MITFKTYLEEMVGRYSPLRQARLKKEKEDRAKKAAPKRNPGTGMRKEGSHGPEGEGLPYPDYAAQFAKKKVKLSKHVDQDAERAKLLQKEEVELDEEAPATNTAGVDMNPTGKPKKQDKRSRFDIDKMFRRANGV